MIRRFLEPVRNKMRTGGEKDLGGRRGLRLITQGKLHTQKRDFSSSNPQWVFLLQKKG